MAAEAAVEAGEVLAEAGAPVGFPVAAVRSAADFPAETGEALPVVEGFLEIPAAFGPGFPVRHLEELCLCPFPPIQGGTMVAGVLPVVVPPAEDVVPAV